MTCDKCGSEMTKVCDMVTKICGWVCKKCGNRK